MYQELLKIPFTDLTVKAYGTMMVIGFLMAVFVMRTLSRKIDVDPLIITNAALYSLIAGVVGARLFFVIHYFREFRENLWTIFAIWRGGLEFLGGVLLAVAFLLLYLRHYKLPVRRCLDILAIGLMLALVFGRVGCFLNGCCWGRPTNLPWGVRFPYGSFAYTSQINTDPARGRDKPYLKIPLDQYSFYSELDNKWLPKPLSELTPSQVTAVTQGRYRSLPVHPTQLYSSLSALAIFSLLLLLWYRADKLIRSNPAHWLARPGIIFAIMLPLYGIARFALEYVRDDNPFEWGHLTVSQILGIGLMILGAGLIVVFELVKPARKDAATAGRTQPAGPNK